MLKANKQTWIDVRRKVMTIPYMDLR